MDRAEIYETENWSQRRGEDWLVPDFTLPLGGDFGDAVISHAAMTHVGLFPRDESDKTIGFMTVDISDPDAPVGLMALMSPEEAKHIAESLLRLADEEYRKKIIADTVEA